MGWSEGSGIGKNLQGMSAPIEVKHLYIFFRTFKIFHLIDINFFFKGQDETKRNGFGRVKLRHRSE